MRVRWEFTFFQRELRAFSEVYARSGEFTRAQQDLRSVSEFFARSEEFTRVLKDLRAFGENYARSGDFTRVQKNLRSFRRIYARSAKLTRVQHSPHAHEPEKSRLINRVGPTTPISFNKSSLTQLTFFELFQYISRNLNFCSLPVAVFGSASTKSIDFGALKCAIFSRV